ncbi:TPA: hypothetical protein DEP21_05490 [Patescibacteria group bacterium]|nr:hypothetical protein [Candidatus Gracilibacteria bacterium]
MNKEVIMFDKSGNWRKVSIDYNLSSAEEQTIIDNLSTGKFIIENKIHDTQRLEQRGFKIVKNHKNDIILQEVSAKVRNTVHIEYFMKVLLKEKKVILNSIFPAPVKKNGVWYGVPC